MLAYTKEKKKLVFLHGYLSSSGSFIYQKDYFSRDFEVYAPDFKGFGKNTGMEKPYSLDDYVEDFIKYLKDNNINKPCIIAHSFGARVILKALYKNPELVDKLVLTGGAGLKPKKSFKKRIKSICFNILKCFVEKQKLKRFYSKDYLALDGVMRESFQKIISEHLDYGLPLIKCKTLLVFGQEDKETPLYMAKKFNREIKDSRLLILKGAGHFCFIDKPHKFNMEVREFLLSEE